MSDHAWVALQYTPLDVALQPAGDGTIDVHASHAAIEIAEDQAVMMCWFCEATLTAESFGTECSPPKIIDGEH